VNARQQERTVQIAGVFAEMEKNTIRDRMQGGRLEAALPRFHVQRVDVTLRLAENILHEAVADHSVEQSLAG
jgi:DNA invertase Pin-like site-specific DNA recombinase